MSEAKTTALGDVLGPLGAAIMEAVWARGEANVGDVAQDLRSRQGRDHAYTTIMTVMGRLHERGALDREKRGRQYVYRPTASRPDLIDQLSAQAVDKLVDRYGTSALRHFALKVADLDPEVRRRLVDLASDE